MGSPQSKVVALQYAAPLRYAAPYSPQIAPILRTFARPVGEADELFGSLWRRADQRRNALLLVFEPDLQLNAVRPNVDAASASEKSPVEMPFK